MADRLGQAVLELTTDDKGLTEGIGKAEGRSERLGRSFDKTAERARRLGKIVAVAMAGVVAALAVGFKRAVNEADNLAKTAQSIGVPVEELSRLQHAADLSGLSAEGLTTSIGRLSRNMSDVAAGAGAEAKRAFDQLGLSVTNSDGTLKSSSQMMTEIAGKFAAMEDGSQKTALAMQLFGRAGLAMVPMLNAGADGLRSMMEEADALGIVIDTQTAKAAERFNDNLTRLGRVKDGIITRMTAGMLPAFERLSQRLIDGARETDAFRIIGEGLGRAMEGLANIFLLVLDGISLIGRGFDLVAAHMDTIGVAALTAGTTLGIIFGPAIFTAIVANFALMAKAGVTAIYAITAAMARNPLGALAVGITIAITALYHFRDNVQQAVGVDVIGIVKTAANLIINSFRAAFQDIVFVWNNLPSIIGAVVTAAANATISGVEGMLNRAVSMINTFIAGINAAIGTVSDIQLGTVGAVSIGRIEGPDLSGALAEHKAQIDAIMASDPLGQLGAMFTTTTPEIKDFSSEIATANAGLDTMETGLDSAAGGVGKVGSAAKAAKSDVGALGQAGASMGNLMQSVGQSIQSAFQGIVDGLINGTLNMKEAISSLLADLGKLFINHAFQALFGGGLGGGGGGLGALFGGFFANGGTLPVGRWGIVGERGPEPVMATPHGVRVLPNSSLQPGGGQAAPPPKVDVNVRNVTVLDPADLLGRALATRPGERVFLNFMRANAGAIRGTLA